ncbi:MAG: tetratricopeptide repeat protein [Desulfatirhabdiaceae bacterium]
MHHSTTFLRRSGFIILLIWLAMGLSACGTMHTMGVTEDQPGTSSEQLENMADSQRERGEYRMAHVLYEQALAKRPDDPALVYKKGLVSLESDRKEDALKDFNKAVAMNPKFSLAYEGMGQAYFYMEDMEKARVAFQKAVDIDPGLWKTWVFLGMVHDRSRQYDAAITAYRLAIELRPRDGALYNNLGVSLTHNQEYDAALTAFKKAIDLNYSEKRVYNNMGIALGLAGRHDAALEAFRKSGREAQAFNNLGVVYLNQKKYTHAIQSFEKAIELEPSFYVTAGENLKKAKVAMQQ